MSVPQPPKTGSIWDDFDEKISALVPQNPTAAGIVEFDKYLDEPLIKRSENPLLWWNDRKIVYPRLYRYMLKRLNIAATRRTTSISRTIRDSTGPVAVVGSCYICRELKRKPRKTRKACTNCKKNSL